MNTYSIDHPSGLTYDLDWLDDAPPTDDQLGALLAEHSGVPASDPTDSGAAPSATGGSQFWPGTSDSSTASGASTYVDPQITGGQLLDNDASGDTPQKSPQDSYYNLMDVGQTVGGSPASGDSSDIFADAHSKHLRRPKRKKPEPYYIQPQTIKDLPDGTVLITNSALNVDIDGKANLSGDHQNDETSNKINGDFPDPRTDPYLVYIDLNDAHAGTNRAAKQASNHGIQPYDFAVIALPTGEIAGGVFLDGGHSLVGEASVRVHELLDNDPGSDYDNRLEKSAGARIIAFPGSGAEFKATGLPYTEKNIQIFSQYLYMAHGYTTGSMMLTGMSPEDPNPLALPIYDAPKNKRRPVGHGKAIK